MATPSKNIYWKDIPASACVEDRRNLYVAHLANGKQAVVFWHGQEAKQAQGALWSRTRSAKNERCIREIKTKTHPLPGLRGARTRRRRRK